ncbi:hypothetical protein HAX54_026233 [Datura stramonium]|uniref:Uncharacterized protein n=1 Tax=Datura stramonium TaxID=4076 RepID=A0ABS8S783_DATST|nr:hypothetical protein [Datura stramonium]
MKREYVLEEKIILVAKTVCLASSISSGISAKILHITTTIINSSSIIIPIFTIQLSTRSRMPDFRSRQYCSSNRSSYRRNIAPNPQPVSAIAPPPPSSAANDGATIEVVRRPRGRPPGSKNKPKPPVQIQFSKLDLLQFYCKSLQDGIWVFRYCDECYSPATINNAGFNADTFHGRFDILSISATIVQPNASVPSNNGIANGFTISLAVHKVKLPVEEELTRNSGGGNEVGSPPQQAVSGGDSGHPPSTTAPESCGMSMFSCHLPSDVIWSLLLGTSHHHLHHPTDS